MHLRPLQNAVQTEVVLAALRCGHRLLMKRIEADWAFLRILV